MREFEGSKISRRDKMIRLVAGATGLALLFEVAGVLALCLRRLAEGQSEVIEDILLAFGIGIVGLTMYSLIRFYEQIDKALKVKE